MLVFNEKKKRTGSMNLLIFWLGSGQELTEKIVIVNPIIGIF